MATDIICLQEYFLEERYRGLFEAELGRHYDFIVSVDGGEGEREGCVW